MKNDSSFLLDITTITDLGGAYRVADGLENLVRAFLLTNDEYPDIDFIGPHGLPQVWIPRYDKQNGLTIELGMSIYTVLREQSRGQDANTGRVVITGYEQEVTLTPTTTGAITSAIMLECAKQEDGLCHLFNITFSDGDQSEFILTDDSIWEKRN